MQDRVIGTMILRLMAGALFVTAFLFLTACGGKAEEKGLEEIAISDGGEDREAGEREDAGNASEDEESSDKGVVPDSGDGADGGGQDDAVYVYVCGAVNTPGVYELDKDARVFEAVKSAGGMRGDASADSVNLARTVTDGEQIYVLTKEEAQTPGAGVGESNTTGSEKAKVNINTASREELMTLTGIGEAKAGSIIRYREEHGGFGSIEELMEIEGIKEGVFGKIKEDITI